MLLTRRSIRKYKDEVVSLELMKEIVDIAKFAPSWANFQITRYNFITNEDIIKQITEKGLNDFTYNIKTLKHAKNVAVISFVKGKSGKLDLEKGDYATTKQNQWEMFDVGIACQTFCLAAHERGIGTCIFGVIDDKSISEILGLPEEETVAAVVTYGYPAEHIATSPRKETKDIVRCFE